jgi:hypothetical protein
MVPPIGRLVELSRFDGGTMQAVTGDTSEGLQLPLTIIAMLIVPVAMVVFAQPTAGLARRYAHHFPAPAWSCCGVSRLEFKAVVLYSCP